MSIRFPKPGETVRFRNGEEVLTGICNGEPRALGADPLLKHLPVYVPDGDRCLMVAAKNITEWPDA